MIKNGKMNIKTDLFILLHREFLKLPYFIVKSVSFYIPDRSGSSIIFRDHIGNFPGGHFII